jgi:hypothetical protein
MWVPSLTSIFLQHAFFYPGAFALSSATLSAHFVFCPLSSSQGRPILRNGRKSYATGFFDPAHVLSAKIIGYLWDNWVKDSTGLRNGVNYLLRIRT